MVLNYAWHEPHCSSLASIQITSVDMVSNEFECEVLLGGYLSTKEGIGTLQVTNDWHLLYPEIFQNINSLNNRLICDDMKVHQGHGRNSFFDTIAEASSSSSSSSLSETTYEDGILPGIGLGKTSTSDSGVTLESDKIQFAFTREQKDRHTVLHGSNIACKPPLMNNSSPMHNPIAQVMDRDSVYDPHRIESSVFAGTDSAPTDWSIASNESLFSLHVGNVRISREQSLFLSGELERVTSLNLSKLAGLNNSHELPLPSTIPKVERKIESQVEEANSLEGLKEKENVVVSIARVVGKGKKEGEKKQPSSARSSSVDSTTSFAFPILGQTDKSGPNSGQPSQFQPGQTWEAAKTTLGQPEPEIVKKRRCSNCFSCSCCPSPSCTCCSSCYSWFSSLCKRSCASCSWKSCCPKWCQPKRDGH